MMYRFALCFFLSSQRLIIEKNALVMEATVFQQVLVEVLEQRDAAQKVCCEGYLLPLTYSCHSDYLCGSVSSAFVPHPSLSSLSYWFSRFNVHDVPPLHSVYLLFTFVIALCSCRRRMLQFSSMPIQSEVASTEEHDEKSEEEEKSGTENAELQDDQENELVSIIGMHAVLRALAQDNNWFYYAALGYAVPWLLPLSVSLSAFAMTMSFSPLASVFFLPLCCFQFSFFHQPVTEQPRRASRARAPVSYAQYYEYLASRPLLPLVSRTAIRLGYFNIGICVPWPYFRH